MVMADDDDDSDNERRFQIDESPREPDNQGSHHNTNTQNIPTNNELPKNSAEVPVDYISLMKNENILENILSLNQDNSKGQILERKHNAKISTKDFSRNCFDTSPILEEFALGHYLTTDNEMLPEQENIFILNEGNQKHSSELEKLLGVPGQPQFNDCKPIFTTTAYRRADTDSNPRDSTFPPVQNGNQIQHVQAECFRQTMAYRTCEFSANIPKTGQMPNFHFKSELACKAPSPMNMPPINTPYPPTTANVMLPKQASTVIPNGGNQNHYNLEYGQLLDSPNTSTSAITANRTASMHSNPRDTTFPPVQNGNQMQHVQAECFGQTMTCTQEAVPYRTCEFSANIPNTGQMHNFSRPESSYKVPGLQANPYPTGPAGPVYTRHQSVNPASNHNLTNHNEYSANNAKTGQMHNFSRPESSCSVPGLQANPYPTGPAGPVYTRHQSVNPASNHNLTNHNEYSANNAKTGQMHNFSRPESSCRVPNLQANPYPTGRSADPVYPHQSVNPASNHNLNASREGPVSYLNPQHQPINPTFNNNLNGSMDKSYSIYQQSIVISRTTWNQNYAQSQSMNYYMIPQNQAQNNFMNPQSMNHFIKSEGGGQTDTLPSNAQHQNMNPTSNHQQNGQSEAPRNRPSFEFQPSPQSRMPPYSTCSTGCPYPYSPYPNSQTGVSMTNSVSVPGNYGSQADNKSSITTRYSGYTDEQKQKAAYLESLRSQTYLGTATNDILRTSFPDNNTPILSNNVNAGLAGRPTFNDYLFPRTGPYHIPIPMWPDGYQRTVTKKEAVKKAKKTQEKRALLRNKEAQIDTTKNMDLIQNTNTNITPNIIPASLSTQAHKQTVNMGIYSTQCNTATGAQNINTINEVQVPLDGGNQSKSIIMTVNNNEVTHLMEDCTQQKMPTMVNKAANIEKTLMNIQNNGEQILPEQDMSAKHNEQTKTQPSVIKATTNTITEHIKSEACVQQTSNNMDVETALALLHAHTEEDKTNVTQTSKTQVQSTSTYERVYTTDTTVMYQKETLVDILTGNATDTLLPQAKTNNQYDQENNEAGNKEQQTQKRKSVTAKDAPSKNPESQNINAINVSDNIDTNHEDHSRKKEIIQPSGSLNDETTVSANENLLNREPIKLKFKRLYCTVDNSSNNKEEPCNSEINVASNKEERVIDALNNCFETIKAKTSEAANENIRNENDNLPEVRIPGKKKKKPHNGHRTILREYTCRYCDSIFKSRHRLFSHLTENHQIANIQSNDYFEKFKCRHCKFDNYLPKEPYTKHIQKHHNDIFTNPVKK